MPALHAICPRGTKYWAQGDEKHLDARGFNSSRTPQNLNNNGRDISDAGGGKKQVFRPSGGIWFLEVHGVLYQQCRTWTLAHFGSRDRHACQRSSGVHASARRGWPANAAITAAGSTKVDGMGAGAAINGQPDGGNILVTEIRYLSIYSTKY